MEERFDVLDASGAKTGASCPRAEVHARGLWHRAFHLFLVADLGGVPCALMQLRSDDKDTAPGCLDVAVGGHFRAGEGLRDVVREVEEELGLAVAARELTFLWTQRVERRGPGYVDREHQDVYLLRRDAPPAAYAPDAVELAGLVALPLSELRALLEGRVARVRGEGVLRGADRATFASGARDFGIGDLVSGDAPNVLRAVLAAEAAFAP